MKKLFSLRREAKKLLKVTALILTTATRTKESLKEARTKGGITKLLFPLWQGENKEQQVNYMSAIFSKAKTLHQQQPGS